MGMCLFVMFHESSFLPPPSKKFEIRNKHLTLNNKLKRSVKINEGGLGIYYLLLFRRGYRITRHYHSFVTSLFEFAMCNSTKPSAYYIKNVAALNSPVKYLLHFVCPQIIRGEFFKYIFTLTSPKRSEPSLNIEK